MKNIVVLVSGSGTNLQRIIDTIDSGEIRNAKSNSGGSRQRMFRTGKSKKNHNIENISHS